MRPMRHIIFLKVFFLVAMTGKGQQVYQFSQYLQNLYILNTATAGLHDYTEVNLSYRKQWVGINNSPTSYYVSANTPLGKRLNIKPEASSVRISSPKAYEGIERKSFHAIGGYAAQDNFGPFGITMAGLSYTFHLPISDQLTISFSPSTSFSTATFDPTKAVPEIAGDPTYAAYLANRTQSSQMDINLAFWLYHTKYFLGYSSDQLVQDRLRLTNQVTLEELKAHHNVIAGYHFKLSRDITLTPSVLIRYVDQSPLAVDFNTRLDYQDRFWAGLSYRNTQSIIGMFGLHLSNTLRFGYAFDFTLSSVQLQNAGSHEVMLGINLFNKEKAVF